MSEILHFESDYMEGAHPAILERLQQINLEKNTGYGLDKYCKLAEEKIKAACNAPDAIVKFLVGGTQTNTTIISAVLRSWQGVISVKTGHIALHEAGAIEATGHKVITLDEHDGKMSSDDLHDYLQTFFDDENASHMVEPGLVYISHPTEYGTLYSKTELENLHAVCKKFNIPLMLDGARLGYGLAAKNTDVTLPVIAKNCDVFYIGGTKVGALFGEAVVVSNPNLVPHFFTVIKQHGALLAKGWLLGLQFDTLFTDDLYFKIAQNAVENALFLKDELVKKGYKLYIDSFTNQQFFIVENERLKELEKKIGYSFWEKYDENHTIIRLATSWATTKESVCKLIELM